MIFGVFDMFHEGHRFFIEDAKPAIIVIARDSSVQKIKNKTPQWHEIKRLEIVQQKYPTATVVLGDEMDGSYELVKKYHPDMICLGYDQSELKADLEAKMASGAIPHIPLRVLKPHEPEKYKSSKFV